MLGPCKEQSNLFGKKAPIPPPSPLESFATFPQEFPEEDDCFNIGDRLGEIESEKTSCDIYSPISGTVCAVNEHLADAPDLINESPEDKGWICKMTDFDPADLDDLMDEEAYMEYVESLD